MRRLLVSLFLTGVCSVTALATEESGQALITMDEDLWVAFYDVPSRRFRDVRNEFVQRNFAKSSRDLGTSASHLRVEAGRTLPELAIRLNDVADRMLWIAENLDNPTVTVTDLDTLFARTHWLLAQHYLEMARRSRDRQQFRIEGRYLLATTHHLERAVLWSGARVDKTLYRTLESLRELASRLQDEKQAPKAHKEKPLLRADKTLRELGALIDRPVVLPAE